MHVASAVCLPFLATHDTKWLSNERGGDFTVTAVASLSRPRGNMSHLALVEGKTDLSTYACVCHYADSAHPPPPHLPLCDLIAGAFCQGSAGF